MNRLTITRMAYDNKLHSRRDKNEVDTFNITSKSRQKWTPKIVHNKNHTQWNDERRRNEKEVLNSLDGSKTGELLITVTSSLSEVYVDYDDLTWVRQSPNQ